MEIVLKQYHIESIESFSIDTNIVRIIIKPQLITFLSLDRIKAQGFPILGLRCTGPFFTLSLIIPIEKLIAPSKIKGSF